MFCQQLAELLDRNFASSFIPCKQRPHENTWDYKQVGGTGSLGHPRGNNEGSKLEPRLFLSWGLDEASICRGCLRLPVRYSRTTLGTSLAVLVASLSFWKCCQAIPNKDMLLTLTTCTNSLFPCSQPVGTNCRRNFFHVTLLAEYPFPKYKRY